MTGHRPAECTAHSCNLLELYQAGSPEPGVEKTSHVREKNDLKCSVQSIQVHCRYDGTRGQKYALWAYLTSFDKRRTKFNK